MSSPSALRLVSGPREGPRCRAATGGELVRAIWIEPPLAIARVGGSPVPCGNFRWAANDLSPEGSGRTGLAPAETLAVAADGSVSASLPAEVVFRDADGIRPMCPFFELWGAWREDDGTLQESAVTPALLERFGLSVGEVSWRVKLSNRKPFHFTLDPACLVEAAVELAGDDTAARSLEGRSPATGALPLVVDGRPLPMGRVQLTLPSAEFPELRLRFTPPVGATYGPDDLASRIAAIPIVTDAQGGDVNAGMARLRDSGGATDPQPCRSLGGRQPRANGPATDWAGRPAGQSDVPVRDVHRQRRRHDGQSRPGTGRRRR